MMTTRNFLTLGTLALVFSFLFASCQKESSDLPTPTTSQNANTGNDGTTSRSMEDDLDELDDLCFDLVYPITVDLPDGTSQTANSDDELETIIEDYYTANPASDEDPTFQFPIDIIDETGAPLTLQDEDELYFMLEMCFEDWDDCFTINYPLTIVYPDGSTQEVADDEALEMAFDDWYDNNPGSDEYPTVQFPIEVTDLEGNVISVADEDVLDELFDECYGDEVYDDEFDLCFDLVFPITVDLPDGTSQVANDYEELEEIFFSWLENNSSSGDWPTFAYPIEVDLGDGEIVTVNDDDELEELLEACEDDEWEECFTFNYPITVLFPDGTSAAVNDDDELDDAIDTWYDNNPASDEDPTLEFPLDVTTEDGEVLTLNSAEELDELLEECFECLVTNGDELVTGGGSSAATATVIQLHPQVKQAKTKRAAKKFAKQK